MNYKRIHFLLFYPFLLIPCYGQGLLNIGEMCVAKNDRVASLYIAGDYVNRGDTALVVQKGNTVLIGDFINEATTGHIFSGGTDNSRLIFQGTRKQHIRGGAGRAANLSHVQFPNIQVNNPMGVWVADSIEIKVKKSFYPRGSSLWNRTQVFKNGIRVDMLLQA